MIFQNLAHQSTSPELFTVTGNPDVNGWELSVELGELLHRSKSSYLISAATKYPLHVAPIDRSDECDLNLDLQFPSNDWQSNYDCSTPPTKHFKLYLHHPDEFVGVFSRSIDIGVGQFVTVLIDPSVIATPINLYKFNVHQRQCYFTFERPLKYYKVYTQNNCRNECFSNYTEKCCGCVKWTMPRK